MASAPAFRYARARLTAASNPSTERASVRAIITKSGSLRAVTAAVALASPAPLTYTPPKPARSIRSGVAALDAAGMARQPRFSARRRTEVGRDCFIVFPPPPVVRGTAGVGVWGTATKNEK